MDLPILVGSAFAAAGTGLALLAARACARTRAFLRGARSSSGVVVDRIERPEGGEVWFFPRVRFTTSEGAEVTFESGMGSTGPTPRIGEAVAVRYRPEQPLRAEVGSFLALWGTAIVLGTIAAAFLLASGAALAGWIPE